MEEQWWQIACISVGHCFNSWILVQFIEFPFLILDLLSELSRTVREIWPRGKWTVARTSCREGSSGTTVVPPALPTRLRWLLSNASPAWWFYGGVGKSWEPKWSKLVYLFPFPFISSKKFNKLHNIWAANCLKFQEKLQVRHESFQMLPHLLGNVQVFNLRFWGIKIWGVR